MATDARLKEQLPDLTERIVDTFTEVGTINHLGHCPLPNYDVIIQVIEDLQEIIYPGYRRQEGLHQGNVGYYVGALVDRLHDRLTTQIGRALRHEARAPARGNRRSISRPWVRPRRSSSSSSFPSSAGCWPSTCKPPTTATRP